MGAQEEWEYTWNGRGGPFTILLAPTVFAPTHTSREVAEGMVVNEGETVIDVGCGSGVPDDIAAVSDWFPGGFSGGPTGAEVPVAMLESSRHHLRPGGRLYLPTGSIQDEGAVLLDQPAEPGGNLVVERDLPGDRARVQRLEVGRLAERHAEMPRVQALRPGRLSLGQVANHLISEEVERDSVYSGGADGSSPYAKAPCPSRGIRSACGSRRSKRRGGVME